MKKRFFLILILILLLPPHSFAEIIFDGYYRTELHRHHVGFIVMRSEWDKNNKQRTLRIYSKVTGASGHVHVEAMDAQQSDTYQPVGFTHFRQDFDHSRHDKAEVHDGFLIFSSTIKKAKTERQYTIPEHGFFSLAFNEMLALNHPRKGDLFKYKAISEADAPACDGSAYIMDEAELKGRKVFRVRNRFCKIELELWISDTGQLLAQIDHVAELESWLVATPESALEDLEFKRGELVEWFREIPNGKINPVSMGQYTVKHDLFPANYLDQKTPPDKEARSFRLF